MFAAALMDPHPLVRLGMARVLGSISTIGEVHVFAPDMLDPQQVTTDSHLSVQILLFGMSHDAQVDRQRLTRLVEMASPRHILLLTDDPNTAGPTHALVAGRVRESAPGDLLEAAIKLVLAGGRCFPISDAQTANASLEQLSASPLTYAIAQGAAELKITRRQFEILALRAQGLSLRGVGRVLGISEATVKAHASAMYRRLDVLNSQQAVQLAQKRGVLPSGVSPAATSRVPDEDSGVR